ncbi:unnamed protein product [Arabis nemorensis]|uniref:Uncharacterized protein n=1 Tax=Arabis nemorensis TaxID=586526 RepID=A0A565CMK4_9BRAS|nr:unnamed protein product [Arabis nemorensis]
MTKKKPRGDDLQLITVVGSGTAVGNVEPQEDEPGTRAYDFGYSFKGTGKHIMEEQRACADFFSLVQPNDRFKLPDIDHMLQGQIESLKGSLDELAAKVEQARLRNREFGEEVVAA